MTMLSTKEAAKRLGVKPDTLRGWRLIHSGPKFHRYSERVFRYDERDVDQYISEHRYDPFARASLEKRTHAHL